MTWPSTYSPGTLGYLVDRIDDQLKRSNTLNSQIQQCITDAITIYQKHRFRFSEGYDYSFVTNPGQEFYAVAGLIAVSNAVNNGSGLVRLTIAGLSAGNVNLSTIPIVQVFGIVGTTEANGTWQFNIIDSTHIDLVGSTFQNTYVSGGDVTAPATASQGGLGAGQVPYQIDYLALQIGTARFEMTRLEPKDIDLLTQSGTQQGQPYAYAYFNEQIRFYPVPSAAYPVIIGAHEIIAAPTSLSQTGNRWMTDGERLIRCRAIYELALHYLKDDVLAGRMWTINPFNGAETGAVPDAFSDLKRESNKITGTGRVRPMQF